MKIIVNSQEEKDTLIEESEYIHYHQNVDTDNCNTFAHIYLQPELIEVRNED